MIEPSFAGDMTWPGMSWLSVATHTSLSSTMVMMIIVALLLVLKILVAPSKLFHKLSV